MSKSKEALTPKYRDAMLRYGELKYQESRLQQEIRQIENLVLALNEAVPHMETVEKQITESTDVTPAAA